MMHGLSIQQSLRQLAAAPAFGQSLGQALAPKPVVSMSRTCIRAQSTTAKPGRQHGTHYPKNHGEQVWVFNHLTTNQVVYSHTPVLKDNRALQQLPFNGKKTKPAKIRKDYWHPMALIQFGPGRGKVGQSVFQKLREFRKLHETSWGYQQDELGSLERKQLHRALCDQRSNSIADMAAVLAGAGAGNRIWKTPEAKEAWKQEKSAAVAKARQSVEKKKSSEADQDQEKEEPLAVRINDQLYLYGATVFWGNDADRSIAREWTENVRHVSGLPSLKTASPKKAKEAVEQPVAEAA